MTTYAYVQAGTVQRTGNIPKSWQLVDGRWLSGFDLHPELWQAEGWLPITEVRATFDPATQQLSAPVYTVNATDVTATYTAVPRPATAINGDTVRAKALAAITANQAFAATVATRRQAIIDAKAQALAAQTATVTTFPQAQTYIRGIATQLTGIDTVIGDLSDQVAALSAQNNALIRLLLGQLDATD